MTGAVPREERLAHDHASAGPASVAVVRTEVVAGDDGVADGCVDHPSRVADAPISDPAIHIEAHDCAAGEDLREALEQLPPSGPGCRNACVELDEGRTGQELAKRSEIRAEPRIVVEGQRRVQEDHAVLIAVCDDAQTMNGPVLQRVARRCPTRPAMLVK